MMPLLAPLLVVCLVLALFLVWVSLTLKQSNDGTQTGWGLGTRYFLVLLRLAIGWHFLVEGWDKLNSSAWSSEVYLQEATGPLAPYFRDLAGERLTTLLTVGPDKQLPAELKALWQGYVDEFKTYYHLNADQTKRAETIFQKHESKLLTWLTSEARLVARPQPLGPPLIVDMTIPERLEDLRQHEEALREIETSYRGTFGRGTFTKLKETKAEVKRLRGELKSDLAKQTAAMQTALRDVLTPDQKAMEPPPATAARSVSDWNRLDWSDAIVKYGLTAVGVCLLAGLLTRTACLAGAAFLLMFFLAMPPLPGWPESPRAEGHYLYLNKNIIEMLALLALATTRSGRWAGLDGLLQFLNPWHRREVPPHNTLVSGE